MTSPETPAPGGSGRVDRVLNATLLGVITLVVATAALTARPPAPPAVAQFAPQAQHHITRAQSRLSGDFGSPGGGPGGTGGLPTPTPKPTVPPVPPPVIAPPAAKSHNCFGEPGHEIQIDIDTQGPPCVPYWLGKNGGATYKGVTADTIHLAIPKNMTGPPNDPERAVQDLARYVNRHFELYDRKIDIYVPGSVTECKTGVQIADDLAKRGIFAVTDPEDRSDDCFDNEVARNKFIVSGRVQAAIPDLTTAKLRELSPYVWNYERPADLQWGDGGNFVCSQLAGGNSVYSSDPIVGNKPRKFGLIFLYYQDLWSSQGSIDAMTSAMSRCGAKFDDVEKFDFVGANQNTAVADEQNWATNAVQHMKNLGITTVVTVCPDQLSCPVIANAASNQSYYPEWLLVNTGLYFNSMFQVGWPTKDERQSVFMLSPIPAQVPYASLPVNRAIAEVDPGFQINDALDAWKATVWYKQLLLIVSGIQMAGPHLTPQTFAAGLHEANFPNPASPAMEGAAQFGDGYGMTQDFTVQWWSDTRPAIWPDDGAGTWCYVQGGRRYDGDYFRTKKPAVLPPPPLATATCVNSPPGS